MRWIIAGLMAVATVAGAQTIPRTPIEADTLEPVNITREQIDAAAELVRLHGYRCDSVSNAAGWVFSRGFTLTCNRFRYTYEIKDHGGRWVVTVAD